MVTPTNRVIAGPNLHRTGPLAIFADFWRLEIFWIFGDFCNIFLPNIGEHQKKSYDFSAGPLAGTEPYYGKSDLD